MLRLQSDSQRTSLTAQIPSGLIRLLNPPDYTAESEQRVLIFHRDVQPTNVPLGKFLSPLSGRREVFNTNVVINSPPLIFVFEVTGTGTRYLVCAQGKQPVQQTVEFPVLAEGPSSASWTIERWALATAFES